VFSLCRFLKITLVAHIFVRFFPNSNVHIDFDKNWLGYILGDF
jgi:hypothetical protein